MIELTAAIFRALEKDPALAGVFKRAGAEDRDRIWLTIRKAAGEALASAILRVLA